MEQKQGAVKKSVSFSHKTYERIMEYIDETGLSFSGFLSMAAIQYLDQRQAVEGISSMQGLLEQLETIAKTQPQE